MRLIAAIVQATGARRGALAGLSLLVAAFLPACVFDLAPLDTNGGGGSGGGACMAPQQTEEPGNLAPNPSFEDGTTGWEGGDAMLTLVETSDALAGKSIMRVIYTGDSASSESYSINDATDVIPSSTAGATYRATAWVRSAVTPPRSEAKVSIILKSDQEGDIADGDPIELGPCFTKIETTGKAEEDGGMIGVHVSQFERAPGDAFDIELIQVFEELP